MWNREFLSVRDGVLRPAASASGRLMRGGERFEYRELRGQKVLAQIHTGYLRAALLSAARDPKAIGVNVSFAFQGALDGAFARAKLLKEYFMFENFRPNDFVLRLVGTEGTLSISFFAAEELPAEWTTALLKRKNGSP